MRCGPRCAPERRQVWRSAYAAGDGTAYAVRAAVCARAPAGSAVGVGGGRRDGVWGAGDGVRPNAGRFGGRRRRRAGCAAAGATL
ncbi:hypothetical protein C6P75_24780 [Burkholderia multivorans]|nr:hypothetical protein C6P75_24780 [Burkholderia multivorans]